MGEPLYFVAGGEKLFKIYLKEILAILCTRKVVSGEQSRRASWSAVDYLLCLVRVGDWGTVKSHDITHLCQARESLPKLPNTSILPL